MPLSLSLCFPFFLFLYLSSSSSLSSRPLLLLSFLSRLLRSLPSSSPEPSKKRNQRSAAKRTDGCNRERGYERNPWVAGYLRREKNGASWTCPRRRPSSPSVASASSAALGQRTRRERGSERHQPDLGGGMWRRRCPSHFLRRRYSMRQQRRPTMCPSPRLRLPPLSSTANARV